MNNSLWRMRIVLLLLLALGAGGIIGIPILKTAQPHSMLDSILPARILNETTTAERMHIADRLRDRYTLDPGFPTIGAGLVLILSAAGLLMSRGPREISEP